MQQIVNFLLNNKNAILFLFLFTLATLFTIQSHNYHKSKFVTSTNYISGGLYSWRTSITDYFHLKGRNERLVAENELLRNIISHNSDSSRIEARDSISKTGVYSYVRARVINNGYNSIDNYILIDKGANDSLSQDMGVITDKGIVGIIENTSANYGRVISILNTNSRINAQLKKSNHYGSLTWNGKDPNIVQLEAIPRLAPVRKGDTIITGGRSVIFPKGIGIGTILNYELENNESYYKLDIRLFNDMTDIGFVYCIRNNYKQEIEALQKAQGK